MVEVEHSDEFEAWYEDLTESDQYSVAVVIEMLSIEGLGLKYPASSAVQNAPFALRELRVNRGNSPIRVFYAFDPNRNAYLILGGDKSNDKKFYEHMIERCTQIWNQYLKEIEEEGR